MNAIKNLLFYTLVIGLLVLLIYFVIMKGESLQAFQTPHTENTSFSLTELGASLNHNIHHPMGILLLQIITIIITARVFGFLFQKIGQPTVIGEIIAGIFLGPSFVGQYFPEFSHFLFPTTSLSNLQFISQIGMVLFMFIVGMELDVSILKKKAHEAVIISHASIIFPFSLGVLLAYYIYPTYAAGNITFLAFALFIGIAMSITAFPVLARIVQERQLTKTKVGAIAITCAAADDITAWCILAAVIAIAKAGTVITALYTILLAALYVGLMLKVVKPFLQRLGDVYSKQETLSKSVVAIFFVSLLVSSWLSEIIGIHALFGAFLAGVIMPQNLNFRNIFIEKVEDVSLVLLLPLFFVFTGLRTQIGLLNEGFMWVVCMLIIGVAVVGKFVGSALAAKFMKQSWRESLVIGALMNTRGLMELVVLNIGFDLKILPPSLFAMFVLMALVTTFMTGPSLDLINFFSRKSKISANKGEPSFDKYSVLFAFGDTERGRAMVRLVHGLTGENPSSSAVSALHLELSSELHHYNIHEKEKESFKPIKKEALKLNLPIQTIFKPTTDLQKEILEISTKGDYDLLIIGMGPSIFEGSFLGRVFGVTTRIINPEKLLNTITGKEKIIEKNGFDERTNSIIRSTKTELGIFADKGLKKIQDVTVLLLNEKDEFLLRYAQKFIFNNSARISFIDYADTTKTNFSLKEKIRALEQTAPNHVALYKKDHLLNNLTANSDLLLVSLEAWEHFISSDAEWIADSPSILILKSI